MTKKTLDELLAEEDDLDLLNVKPAVSKIASDESRIEQGFEEISDFVDRNGFPPGEGPEGRRVSPAERTLAMRLRATRSKPELAERLNPLDRHGLLRDVEPPSPSSLDELLDSDDELLNDPNESIFSLRHVRRPAARPDKVSERVACTEFEAFKPLFDRVAADLASGERNTMRFKNEQEIEAGGFFILNGVMAYVAEVNDPHVRNGKRNARLRLVFENGTEGQNLLRSLATELYKDPAGRRISEPNAGPLFDPTPTTETISAPVGRVTGHIYVVRSLSHDPAIRKLGNEFYKIGFTSGSLDDRLRGAKDDPTFLLAPVHLVRSYDAIDMNANRFEHLIHRFFADACLDIEILDRFGKPFRPREWFLLPIDVVERAVKMLVDGSIVHHRYDRDTGELRQISDSCTRKSP